MRPIARIPESAATVTRHFRFQHHEGMWSINQQFFDKSLVRVDANPRAGDVEIWELENASGGWTHPIHIHLINFQILDRNGAPPAPGEAGWKETVLLHHNETVRVIMQWYDVPDGPARTDGRDLKNRYVFHCHNLEHEDHMMMGEIEVQARV